MQPSLVSEIPRPACTQWLRDRLIHSLVEGRFTRRKEKAVPPLATTHPTLKDQLTCVPHHVSRPPLTRLAGVASNMAVCSKWATISKGTPLRNLQTSGACAACFCTLMHQSALRQKYKALILTRLLALFPKNIGIMSLIKTLFPKYLADIVCFSGTTSAA